MPGAIDADVVARQHLGAAARSQPERLPRGHRLRPAASARDEQRLLDVVEEVAALVRRRAVDAEPDAHARLRASPAPARRPLRGGGSTSGSARHRCPVAAKRPISASERWTQWAHQTSPSSQPSESRYSTGVQPYSSWQYASSSTVSARCVCSCRPRRRASSADSVIRRPVTENGEQGATAIWTRAPGPGLVQLAGEALGVGEHGVDLLDELVGRQAAVGGAEVHRAARGDEPAAELLRGLHLGLDQPGAAAREDVVVVEDRRAAGEHQLRDARCGPPRTPPRRRSAPTSGRARPATRRGSPAGRGRA